MRGIRIAGDLAGAKDSDWQLKLLQPQEIRSHWPFIRSHLEKILAKTHEDWIPEDVYASLVCNSSCALIFDHGVLVVRREVDEWTNIPYLFIWCVSLDKGSYIETLDKLRLFAAQMGVKSIRGESPRLGWAKKAKKLSSVYEVEI